MRNSTPTSTHDQDAYLSYSITGLYIIVETGKKICNLDDALIHFLAKL